MMTVSSWTGTARVVQPATTSIDLGFFYRIDEPRAAFAVRLARLDSDNARRAATVEAYREGIERMDASSRPCRPPKAWQAHHLCRCSMKASTATACGRAWLETASRRASITRPCIASAPTARPSNSRFTDAYSRRSISLPLFPTITSEQVALVREVSPRRSEDVHGTVATSLGWTGGRRSTEARARP